MTDAGENPFYLVAFRHAQADTEQVEFTAVSETPTKGHVEGLWVVKFTSNDGEEREYAVCIEDKQREILAESVLENLGLFNPSFIRHYFPDGVHLDADIVSAIQESCGEVNSTKLFLALIPPGSSEFKRMIGDMLACDGFSHHLNSYGGAERVWTLGDEKYITFRIQLCYLNFAFLN